MKIQFKGEDCVYSADDANGLLKLIWQRSNQWYPETFAQYRRGIARRYHILTGRRARWLTSSMLIKDLQKGGVIEIIAD